MDELPVAVQGGAVAIGNFDGVHRGHRVLIERLKEVAAQVDGPTVVFTFDPPPMQLLRPSDAPIALTWMERRAELLFHLGVDYVVAYPTDFELLSLGPAEFFQRIIVESLGASGIVEGTNFRFGKNREGDVERLISLGSQFGVQVEILRPQTEDGEWISSTRVRERIESGDFVTANALLTEPYRIRGKVVHGAARGRTIGIPTANLDSISVLLPKHGVYAGRVAAVENRTNDEESSPIGLPVAINIGPNPTFGDNATKFEAHIIGFSGELYDSIIEIEMLKHVRDVIRFDSLDALRRQLASDIEACGS